MRPAGYFSIIQLSNSRDEPYFIDRAGIGEQSALFTLLWKKETAFAIIPSLTVEKKNECHNP